MATGKNIQAAVSTFNAAAQAADVTYATTGNWNAAELQARQETEAALVAILRELGFTYFGGAWQSKKHGRVEIHKPATIQHFAVFHSATGCKAIARRNAAFAAALNHERMY